MRQRLLYQFPISHYCEKARWCLDFKGLPYERRNLLPGPHMLQARLLAGSPTVPILRDGRQTITDSTHIALYLEKAYPERPLLPADGASRAQALAQEGRLDQLGDDVRRWIYSELLPLPNFAQVFYHAYELPARWAGYLMAPVLKRVLPDVYRVRPDAVASSRQRMLAGLRQLETDLGHNPARYLVGKHFTLADLTAAALYGPLLCPPGSPWAAGCLTPGQRELREELEQRVAGQWLLRLYHEHRQASLVAPD